MRAIDYLLKLQKNNMENHWCTRGDSALLPSHVTWQVSERTTTHCTAFNKKLSASLSLSLFLCMYLVVDKLEREAIRRSKIACV